LIHPLNAPAVFAENAMYVFCTCLKVRLKPKELPKEKNLANIALYWWGGAGSNRRPTDYEERLGEIVLYLRTYVYDVYEANPGFLSNRACV
jgi:hypothetical protein